MLRIILIIGILFSLTGCLSPTTLGISETEWQTYTPEQQKKIKSGYYEVLKTKVEKREEAGPLENTKLLVKISGGKTNMPPFTQLSEYKPVEFQLSNGSCRSIRLEREDGQQSVEVKACFQGKSLYIDPSAYDVSKKVGSIRLYYSPVWDRGFTFENVSSSGYAHLTNVNVTVKVLNSESDHEDSSS